MDQRAEGRTIAEEAFGGDTCGDCALGSVRHDADEADEQPDRDRRRKENRKGKQTAIVR